MNSLRVLKSFPQISKQVIYKRGFQASPRMLGGGHDDGEHHAHPVSLFCFIYFVYVFFSGIYVLGFHISSLSCMSLLRYWFYFNDDK